MDFCMNIPFFWFCLTAIYCTIDLVINIVRIKKINTANKEMREVRQQLDEQELKNKCMKELVKEHYRGIDDQHRAVLATLTNHVCVCPDKKHLEQLISNMLNYNHD